MHFTYRLGATMLLTIAAALTSATSIAAGGDADPSFGGAGYVRYAAPKIVPGLVGDMLGLDDGSVIVAGGADTDVFVRHYRVDGSLDDTFGSNGTTLVPGFTGAGRIAPNSLHLLRDASGRILVEQDGTVRRLFANGAYDPNYLPAKMDVVGRSGGLNVLPQRDGRFVIVSGLQGFPTRPPISVRFFNADGTPDTSRGSASGERLLSPSEGTYTEGSISAAIDADGRILIAARWDRNASDISLVLFRLNADGTDDITFGQNGVVLIGSHLGNVGGAQLKVGSDGRVAYFFTAPVAAQDDPYFVVYVLTNSGQPDTSAPSGGRLSVVVPRSQGTDFRLRLASGPPGLAVIGVAITQTSVRPAPALMSWRADLTTGSVGTPAFTSNGLAGELVISASTLASTRLWIAGGEDPFVYGRIGASPLTGYGRGVLAAFDTASLAATPARSVISLNSNSVEAFTDAKVQSDGSIVALGTYIPERQQAAAPTLTRFTADGRIDPAYGVSGRVNVAIAAGDNVSSTIVPSSDDAITVLRWSYFCGIRASSCLYAGLSRFTKDGLPDPAFGTNGQLPVANGIDGVFALGSGFVDSDKAVNLLQSTAGNGTSSVIPLRFTPIGVDAGFHASAQTIPGFSYATTLDPLSDGRMQAISVGGGNQALLINVLRWQKNGAVDPSMPTPLSFSIPAADASSTADDVDSVVLPDGRTLIAIDQASQRIVVRLRADGRLDATFGTGGTARIDGTRDRRVATVKLAVDALGRILLTYNTPLGTGTALTVARFTADGQRDSTFTADGRFDSLFSLSATESASDLITLPDGGILAVGRSDGHGLILRLKGTFVQNQLASTPVVEFFNTLLNHYFISSGAGEIVAVDKGAAGLGWERTGYGFRAFTPETGVPPGALPVCRFYGTPGRGPNGHFYTVIADECAAVKHDAGWTYEGIAFYAYAPVGGQCASGQQSVYRVYNNRFAQNDSNHRYLTDGNEYARMQTLGWVPEGVVLCGAAQ